MWRGVKNNEGCPRIDKVSQCYKNVRKGLMEKSEFDIK